MAGEQRVDVLGAPYLVETLDLPADAEGPVVATLVSRPADHPRERAVLHVHGFNDYFFQTAAADFWTGLGYDFYALDLRKHGRSLLDHQTANFVLDLAEYFPDLDAAMARVRDRDGHRRVVLSGHSTGGLIVSLWMHERRPPVDGLVLNSPWLGMHGSLPVRLLLATAVDRLGARAPHRTVPRSVSSLYGQSLHRDHSGEWDFDVGWKVLDGRPVYVGWLRAVRHGQARVHRGIDVGAPVLVLTSDSSSRPKRWEDGVDASDVVLNVDLMWRWAPRLGPRVAIVRVPGALHDITLSREPVRRRAFAEVERWLTAYVER